MLETIINDVSAIIQSTFLNGDWMGLLIAFGSVLIAALIMRRASQIGAMTLLALVLFVLGWFFRGAFLQAPAAAEDAAAVTGGRIMSQIDAQWGQFMGMEAGTLLAYFIAFMLLILLLFGVKAAVSRG